MRSEVEGTNDVAEGLDRLLERVRGGLQTLADVGEFPGREVDPLLLCFRACLLVVRPILGAVSPIAHRLELPRHCLNGAREVGQIACEVGQMLRDLGYVILGCHVRTILRPGNAARALPTAAPRPSGAAAA